MYKCMQCDHEQTQVLAEAENKCLACGTAALILIRIIDQEAGSATPETDTGQPTRP